MHPSKRDMLYERIALLYAYGMYHTRMHGHTVRVWYTKLYHTRTVHTIRVWYVPYAYGIKYAYGTEHAHVHQSTIYLIQVPRANPIAIIDNNK